MKRFAILLLLLCWAVGFVRADLPVTSGLALWLDASNTASLTAQDGVLDHGDRIQIWKDVLTGDNAVGDDFSQYVTSRQPIWFEQVGVLDGSSAVLFDGVATFMHTSSLYIGPDMTVFIVAQHAVQLYTAGSIHRPILAADNNPFRPDGTGYGIAYQLPPSTELVVSLGDGSTEQKLVGAGFNQEDWAMNIMTFRRQGTTSSEIWQRTVRDAEDVLMGTETALTRTSGLYTGYELGAESGHSARYYKGFVAEVIIYNRTLGDAEMELVSDYLYDKHFDTSVADPFGALLYLPFENDWHNQGTLVTESGAAVTYDDITPRFGLGVKGHGMDLSHAEMSKLAGCVLYGAGGAEDTLLETELNGLQSLTLCGWFNATSGSMKSFSGFLGRMSQVMVRSYDDNSRLVLGINNIWTSTDPAVTYAETGEWVFWAVSYDGTQSSNNVKWYKGDDAGTLTLLATHSLNAGSLNNIHDELAVGNLLVSGAYAFEGLLDEMRIFGSKTGSDGALNAAGIEEVYQHGLSPACGDSLHPHPAADVNQDCIVNLEDFAELLYNWQVDVN